MRTPLWISQPDPIVVVPSRATPGWMIVSAPIVTSGSMYAVARRRFADEARRRGRERRLTGLLPVRGSSDYEPVAGALREALATLPGGQSQVVLLKLVRGLTFAEIGTEVGLTEAAAKMRFVRALEQLRADLSERGIEP